MTEMGMLEGEGGKCDPSLLVPFIGIAVVAQKS